MFILADREVTFCLVDVNIIADVALILYYYIVALKFFFFVYYLFICSAYVSIASIDWIGFFYDRLQSMLILLTSSVNTICFLLLNLCCDFNSNL